MGCRLRAKSGSPESLEVAKTLRVGDRVRFLYEAQARFKVQLRSDRFIILTRPQFGDVVYTVIDLQQGRRGPDDSWGTGYESAEEIAEALEKLESGHAALSERRAVSLEIADVRRSPEREVA